MRYAYQAIEKSYLVFDIQTRSNQDLNKEAAVEFNNVTTEKVNTKTVETPTFVTSDKDISAYDLSAFENGTLINMKDGLKVKQWRKDCARTVIRANNILAAT